MNKRIAMIVMGILMVGMLLAPLPAAAKGVVLNFSDVDISTMVKFISDLTGKNFVMDDRVKGKISVFSPTKLSPEEAFNLFTSVLELKGFTLIQVGKVYKIMPTPGAKQSGMKVLTDQERGPVNESYVARVISLDRISAQEAVTFLQPVVSKDGVISAFGPANMVLVVDSAVNIQKILGIVQVVDTEQRRDKGEILFLKNASAESVAKMVGEWLRSRDKSARTPAQGASTGIVVADTRLNALMVFGSDKDKEDVRNIIAMVDVVPPTSSSKINVFYLENADATEVAKVMDLMIKGGGAPLPGQPAQVASPQQQSPFEGGKIAITPDKATNSLVIMASPTDYQNLLQVIQKLDKRRRQVFVQAVIAEISLNKLKDWGTQFSVSGGGVTGNTALAGVADPFGFLSGASSQQSAVVAALQQLITAGSNNIQVGAVLHALSSNGVVNVLSTPNIMTSDNKEAEIFVGQNVPFRGNVTISSTTTPSFQSIERKDTGITLKITPQISEGEYVKLDLYQEISAIEKTSVSGAADLITTKRSAKTSVVVKDRETILIGGLIQDRDTETINKIPLLGDIPIIGYLFKTKNASREKTNLLILLSPRIIRGAQEMTEVTDRQKQKFGEAVKTEQPFSLDGPLKTQQ